MQDNHTRTLAIFAIVFFVLTMLSGGGFFGSLILTGIVTVLVHFGLRYFESKKNR